MAEFFYRAMTAAGKPVEGTLAGDSEKAVTRQLHEMALYPIYIGFDKHGGRAAGGGRLDLAGRLFRRRIRARDRLFFTQELATLVSSGLPLDRALSVCSELNERPAFRAVIAGVLNSLRAGKSLTDSLAAQPEVFSDLYVNMIRAGEASGSLDVVLQRLAEFERASDEFRSSVISALIYPALLTLVGAGSILVMMNYVVPKFAAVFEESRVPIPTPTYVMLRASELLRAYGWMVAAGVVGLALGIRWYVRTPAGRRQWHALKLKLPLAGDLFRKAETARFARTMSTLVGNGVPLVQSLKIVKGLLNNVIMGESLAAIALGVQHGEGLAGPLQRTRAFPPLAGHLLTVGEETGKLDAMFTRMADIYDNDTRAAIKRATALFEPLVILVMGLIVGVLVLSMLLAIVSINDVPM
jgi:general secretion pathway protein F